MKKPSYYNALNIPYSWQNLNFTGEDNVITVMDAIEDSKNGKELCERLKNIKMVHNTWKVDRESDKSVRIYHVDTMGNITYITCEKEPEKKNKNSLNSYELSSRIFDCLSDGYDDEEDKEEAINALYDEISQISGDSFIRCAFERLCERIEELS